MMYYTIYKITNLTNGKVYIGKHQTTNINDSYMGSGVGIRRAIKKHGKENFAKEILFVFDNPEDMDNKERELITEEFVQRKDTYNAGVGGEGGPHFAGKTHTRDSIEQMLKTRKERGYTRPPTTEETRRKISEAMKGNTNSKVGRKLSKETRRKISEAIKRKHAERKHK